MKKNLHNIKSQIQKEALQQVLNNGGSGLITICTGGGKSKIAIDYMSYLHSKNTLIKCLLVVPTEKLRDLNWKNEFEDWNQLDIYNNNLERTCYASLHKIENQEYDLVILDEAHRITENNSIFYKNNIIKHIIGLTATPPEDELKIQILSSFGLKNVYSLPLDKGVEIGLVAPYNIKVIELNLDSKDKYIESGAKQKRFKTTEKSYYDYLSRMIMKIRFSGKEVPNFMYINRMRFIYNLKSKTKIAKLIIDKIPNTEKTLIFCGSKLQAQELCENYYHSGTDDKSLILFMNDKINKLSCVNSLNEGINISNIDTAVVVQLDSKELNLIQRIGRVCRYRENHLATIYILSVIDTQDEKWVKDALKSFDQNNIEYINVKNLLK